MAKLETLRTEKTIGKSLEAVATLHINESESVLQNYADSLPELFNVSEVDFLIAASSENDYLPTLSVKSSPQPKCDRCWRHVPDVGDNANYPTVCLRCAEALDAIDFPPYTHPAPSTQYPVP